MGREDLGQFVRDYLQRVVNQHDMSALDDMVSPDYRGNGPGWPPDIGSLREFYQWQQRWRPDWHIDVQETVEVGDWVAVRACAGGTVSHDDAGAPLLNPFRKSVEWLAVYRVVDEKVTEMQVLSAVDGPAT